MPQPQNFTCQICGQSFNSRDQLLNHSRSQHSHQAQADDSRKDSSWRAADDEVSEGGPT